MGRLQWHNIEGSPIIVTENVTEYRRCIAQHICSSDVVLEVGCAEGLTTALIAQQADRVSV
jgi:protein-L-isoaspartate O-methyltransferase